MGKLAYDQNFKPSVENMIAVPANHCDFTSATGTGSDLGSANQMIQPSSISEPMLKLATWLLKRSSPNHSRKSTGDVLQRILTLYGDEISRPEDHSGTKKAFEAFFLAIKERLSNPAQSKVTNDSDGPSTSDEELNTLFEVANWHKKRIAQRGRWTNLSLSDYAPPSVQSILPNHSRSHTNTATTFDRPGRSRPVLSNSRDDFKIKKTRTDQSGIGYPVKRVRTTATVGSEGSVTDSKFSCTVDDPYKHPTIDGQLHDLSHLSWPEPPKTADVHRLEEQAPISSHRAESRFLYPQTRMSSERAWSQTMIPTESKCIPLHKYCVRSPTTYMRVIPTSRLLAGNLDGGIRIFWEKQQTAVDD